jgi:hypothetical protein
MTFTGSVDVSTLILMCSNFFVAIPAVLAFLQSRANQRDIQAAKVQVAIVHSDLAANTTATKDVALSVNGKLDRVLTLHAEAAHADAKEIMDKLDDNNGLR